MRQMRAKAPSNRAKGLHPVGADIRPKSAASRFDSNRLLFAREDDVSYQRIDLISPAVAAEYTIMPDAWLQVVPLEIRSQSRAQLVRGCGLSDRAYVVALAFDREQHGALDGPRLDQAIPACPRPRHAPGTRGARFPDRTPR